MKAISQHVHGELWEEDGHHALFLLNTQPEDETELSLFLRYAFVTRGREEHILPAFLLDDWGNEIRGRRLYEWVAESGEQFPRAEIFGYERNGAKSQTFLRALELYATHPLYVYLDKEQPVAAGKQVEVILLPAAGLAEPRRVKRPSDLKRPLRRARVVWWQVPPRSRAFDFSLLQSSPDPGI